MTASPGFVACPERSVSTRQRMPLRISRAIATPSIILAVMVRIYQKASGGAIGTRAAACRIRAASVGNGGSKGLVEQRGHSTNFETRRNSGDVGLFWDEV